MKTKLHKITIGLGIAGILIILFSFVWHVVHQNMTQFVIAGWMGMTTLAFAYIYEYFKGIEDNFSDVNAGIDGLNIWTRRELEEIREDINKIKSRLNRRK